MSQGNESLQETMLDRVIWEEGLINIFELKAKENLNPTKNWFVSLGITAFQAGGTKGKLESTVRQLKTKPSRVMVTHFWVRWALFLFI